MTREEGFDTLIARQYIRINFVYAIKIGLLKTVKVNSGCSIREIDNNLTTPIKLKGELNERIKWS